MADNGTFRLWEKIKSLVDNEIDRRTRSCCRMKKMTVAIAYNSSSKTVGVQEAFGRVVDLPVFGGLDTSKLSIGAAVWVMIPHSSMSNAIVFMLGDGST